MDTLRLSLALSGPDLPALFRAVVDAGVLGDAKPVGARIDGKARKPDPAWLDTWPQQTTAQLMVDFDDVGQQWLSLIPDRVVKLETPFPASVARTLELLQGLPFALASATKLFREWGDAYPRDALRGFGDGHNQHGWMCAFKGAGHDRLVSRRWLDFGPWAVHRGADDTTLVQFHDLAADWQTALAQARPGHDRMGVSDDGGFLQQNYVFQHDLRGDYLPDQRALRIVVAERDLTRRELLDACAMRHYQILGPERPIDSIAYWLMDEGAARAHLHELWLRELECWGMVDDLPRRLDTDHAPQPDTPEWVRQLAASVP